MMTVTVLGATYTIVDERLDPDLYGECKPGAKVISINRDANRKQKAETIFHEVLHAILYETGLNHILEDGHEEAIVRAMEHGLVRSGLLRNLEEIFYHE